MQGVPTGSVAPPLGWRFLPLCLFQGRLSGFASAEAEAIWSGLSDMVLRTTGGGGASP